MDILDEYKNQLKTLIKERKKHIKELKSLTISEIVKQAEKLHEYTIKRLENNINVDMCHTSVRSVDEYIESEFRFHCEDMIQIRHHADTYTEDINKLNLN